MNPMQAQKQSSMANALRGGGQAIDPVPAPQGMQGPAGPAGPAGAPAPAPQGMGEGTWGGRARDKLLGQQGGGQQQAPLDPRLAKRLLTGGTPQ